MHRRPSESHLGPARPVQCISLHNVLRVEPQPTPGWVARALAWKRSTAAALRSNDLAPRCATCIRTRTACGRCLPAAANGWGGVARGGVSRCGGSGAVAWEAAAVGRQWSRRHTSVASLEVTPASVTVAVGGTAQYSVVARDGAGLVIATPPLTWTRRHARRRQHCRDRTRDRLELGPDSHHRQGWQRGQPVCRAERRPEPRRRGRRLQQHRGGARVGGAAGLRLPRLDTRPANVEVFAEHDVSASATLTPAGSSQSCQCRAHLPPLSS